MPYSCVSVSLLFTAYTWYLQGRLQNQYQAAIYMNCNSRHSFRLYYTRINNQLGIWYDFFQPQIGGKKEETTSNKWQPIVSLMRETVSSDNRWQSYLNTLTAANRMGLGP
jgi:hypothetical protein